MSTTGAASVIIAIIAADSAAVSRYTVGWHYT